MRGVWRVAEVRAAEQALMATLPEGMLMQRAAAGLARRCALLLADTGGVYGRCVQLLVGTGDNGGDALYAGALLARRGVAVSALLLDPARAHSNGLAALRAAGGTVSDELRTTADILVDGIVGIGAKGALRGRAAELADELAALRAEGRAPTIVAVDVPSGVEVDTAHVEGSVIHADVTVTFGCLKPALVVAPAARCAGQVELVDIGLRPWLRTPPALQVPEHSDVASWWPVPYDHSDKYRRGVVGLATGSARYSGAAVLSVAGALAGPAGMVRYAGGAAQLVRQHHPSVIVTERVGEAGRVQAWVCGSGLGTDDLAAGELRAVLAAPVPVVLDADALNLLADGSPVVDGSLTAELRQRQAPLVITPHDGEFARLAGEPPGNDRVAAALRLAARMNAIVLLKGDRTIVATPGGRAWVNPTGTPALATAGSGDVLAGLLGSLLAGGLDAERAAVAAAYVHGLAGAAAATAGPVTAVDVAGALRGVVGELCGASRGR